MSKSVFIVEFRRARKEIERWLKVKGVREEWILAEDAEGAKQIWSDNLKQDGDELIRVVDISV